MKFRINHFLALCASIVMSIVTSPSISRAGDIDSAKQQLQRVKVDVDNGSWDSVDADIKATEEFLDGLPAADKDPVQKELDGLKVKAAAGVKEYKSKRIVESAKRNLDSAASDIASSPVDVTDRINQVIEKLKSDDAKKYVDPDELAKLQKRADSLHTMAGNKASKMKLERADAIMKDLDDEMAKDPLKGLSSNEEVDRAAQSLTSLIQRVRGAMEGVPATDPHAKDLSAKLDGYEKKIQAAAGGAMTKQAAEDFARGWKGQQEYFAGWEKETAGPTWAQYTHESSQSMSDLNMTKTIEVLRRVGPWLSDDYVKKTAEQYKDDASIKATLADAHKTYDAAAAKLNTAFNSMMDQADKVPTPSDDYQRNKADYLATSADHWFAGTPFHDANVARAKKLFDKWKGAVEGDAAAKKALFDKMTADATAAWPAIAASIKAEDGFTPDKAEAYKGKIIHLKGNNRLGYDYQPGSYNFEKEINGMPVAGRFDKNVNAAFENANTQTHQYISDENWDLYAVVEGPGQIEKRSQRTGRVKINGQDAGTVSSEVNETVPCTVVRIFALHAGPVAVGSVTGASGASSTSGGSSATAVVAGGTGSRILSFIAHFLEFILCVFAAGLIFVKGKPALAGQMAGAGSPTSSIFTNEHISLTGLVFAILGVLWLLYGLIYRDFFPAISLTLAGVYLAADWLNARKILPPSVTDPIKPFGMPIAGAAALFGFLHIFLGNLILF